MTNEYDEKLDKDLREYSQRLVGAAGERHRVMDEMEDMYFMRSPNEKAIEKRLKHIKQTKSPDPRNAIRGGVNLMTVTEPQVMVPYDTAYVGQKEAASKLEKAAKTMLSASGSVRGNRVHYDVALTGLLFDEIHILLNRTDDIVRHAAGSSKASQARVKRIAEMTPVLFDVVDPRKGYYDTDSFGLRAYYREFDLTVGEILDQYGDKAREYFAGSGEPDRYATRTVCDMYTLQHRQVWIKDGRGVIEQYEHDLEFIPVVVVRVNGSQVLEDTIEPFLYTYGESGLWSRANLALTVMYSRLFSLLTPGWIEKQAEDKAIKFEFDPILPRVQVPAGNDLVPMNDQGGLSPALEFAYKLAEQKGQESMIYPQALGQPMGGQVAYSTVALLNQAGRLPLVQVQQKGGFAISEALRLAFTWMRGKRLKAKYKATTIELDAAEIPDPLEIEVTLDVHMPQDMLGKANIAGMLVDRGITSMRWLRDEVLGMQADDMDYEIMSERAAMKYFDEYMQGMSQVMQMAMQQAQGGANPAMSPGGPEMAGMPGQPPPGMTGPAEAGGLPIAPGAEVGGPGGMPPEMLMQGGQGPQEVR